MLKFSFALLVASCSQPSKMAPAPVATMAPTPVVAQSAAAVPVDVLTDPRAILAAQRILIQLGYDLGKADGISGPATRRVILAFQRDHGLVEDGLLTEVLFDRLRALQSELAKPVVLTVDAGDTLVFSDGAVETAAAQRSIGWDQTFGGRGLVAVRPSTAGWPAAARAGLDWATTHALDVPGPPVQWASTGVTRHFEIRAYPELSAREAELAGKTAQSCRRFEMRAADRRYPAIACLDAKGIWYIPRSRLRLARPAGSLGVQTPSKPVATGHS